MGTDTQLISPEVNQERVQTLYTNTRDGLLTYYAWWLSIIVVLFISDASTLGLVTLVAAIVSASLVQQSLQKAFFNAESIEDENVWERRQTIVTSIEGFIVSAGAMLLLDLDQPLAVYAVVFLIIAAAFSAVLALVSSVQTYYSWMLVLLMPLAINLGLSGKSFYIIIAVLVILAGASTASLLAKGLHKEFLRSLQLRFENLDLIEKVKKERNIAEQERSRAEKANTDKSRFLAATSHDLRQPLHALDLFLGGLKNRLQIEENRKILGNAQASSRSLGDLLNALLDVSRLDAGEVTVHKQILPLQPLLQESCNELYPVAQAKGLTLKLRCADNLYINTDAILFTRVLRNYILNAIRYTQQGTILVGVRKRGSDVRLEVWDTGRGIDDKQQKHIFDEYYQIDNPERDSEKGLGLGLAIVKRLSDLLGHPIGFKSELGRGSCFYITMPQASLADYIEPEARDLGDNVHDLTGLFVLVIDDHQSILDGMRNLLRDWDCEVLMGQSLDDIMRELKALDYPVPDVLLIDYRLRENKTGDVAIQTVRAFFDSDIPAVLMTGEVGHDMEILAHDADAKLVHKPLPADDLKALLQQFVKPQG